MTQQLQIKIDRFIADERKVIFVTRIFHSKIYAVLSAYSQGILHIRKGKLWHRLSASSV